MNSLELVLKRRIQPFERVLAKMEIAHALGRDVSDNGNGMLTVVASADPRQLADYLTYCREVAVDKAGVRRRYVTRQVRREGTAFAARKIQSLSGLMDLLPFREDPPDAGHRELRYGPHGLHEYKGKYFPQLVKSLLSLSGSRRGALVLDPWVGSGTTLVEAALNGFGSLGVDLNPLSVLISNTKLRALTVPPRRWLRVAEDLESEFSLLAEHESFDGRSREVTEEDILHQRWPVGADYLLRWFTPPALAKIGRVLQWAERLKHKAVRDVMRVSLSNILREVSLQNPDDLRVRRRRSAVDDPPVYGLFLQMALRNIRSLFGFSLENDNSIDLDGSAARLGDSREVAAICQSVGKTPDVVVTSPPYCTALPYIDTDRLSLVVLGMTSPRDLGALDGQMIGSREINPRERERLEARYAEQRHLLPHSVRGCIDAITEANRGAAVGFRRLNTPGLVARYFFDMRQSLSQLASVLPAGATCFVVVGNNRTGIGETAVTIQTDCYLADMAAEQGFKLTQMIPMDMLVARDIHRQNAVKSETILWLRRKGPVR